MSDEPKQLKHAFQEGVEARVNGLKQAENPYDLSTEAHSEWAAGWCATFDLDEEHDPASTRDTPADDPSVRVRTPDTDL